MNVHPFAKAPELMGPRPNRIPHKRTFGRFHSTRGKHFCPECGCNTKEGGACRVRSCQAFVGQRDPINPDVNSLDRATRLAAQPQRREKRLAKNCKRPTMTADRRPK